MIAMSRVLGAGLLLGLAAAVVLAVAPPPAHAHPFGDPQTLAISGDGERVVAQWRAGGLDDLTLLGVALGVLPEDRIFLDGAVDVRDSDPAALAEAPEFADYLVQRIEISSGGEPCPLEVADVAALAHDGAQVVATCPAAGPVEVTSTMLTDLHPAYQLLATGPHGQRARYDVDHPSHTWTLGGAAEPAADEVSAADTGLGHSAAVQIGGVLAGVALLGAAAVVVRRRSRRAERAA